MMRTRFSSVLEKNNLLGAVFAVVILSQSLQAFAGVAVIPEAYDSHLLNTATQFQVNAAPVTVTPNSQAERESPFVISAPANDRIDSLNVEPNADFQISIPDLPADIAPTANVSNDSAHAIPLPPAVESGITGIVALGLGAGLKRLRRAFR